MDEKYEFNSLKIDFGMIVSLQWMRNMSLIIVWKLTLALHFLYMIDSVFLYKTVIDKMVVLKLVDHNDLPKCWDLNGVYQ
jgi:hypothetical protein